MALARIITRSHACSRELAFDLLARGYAVEIVSPDQIPDGIADLELRVEEDPGNQLTATVKAHNGNHSASLDFLHHLKAPMADFVRRPAEPGESFQIPAEVIILNAGPSTEDLEPHAKAPQLARETVFPVTTIPVEPYPEPENAGPILRLDSQPPVAVETPSHFAGAASTIAIPIAQPAMVEKETVGPTILESTIFEPTIATPKIRPLARMPLRRGRRAGLFRGAALTFASIVLLALILGSGLHRYRKAATQTSNATPAEKALVTATVEKDSGQVANFSVSPPATKSGADSEHPLQEPSVANEGTLTAGNTITGTKIAGTTSAGVSRSHELIARDTVTYLDQRYKPALKPKSSRHGARPHPSSQKRSGGATSANTVTYLTRTPVPKPAK